MARSSRLTDRSFVTPVALAVLLTLSLAACGTAPASPTSTLASPATPAATPFATPAAPTTGLTPVPADSGSPAPATDPPTQTDTEWGRIWDALPRGFPLPPGATAAQSDEPVSAAFDLPIGADEAATFMQGALELANFSTLSRSGPFEDGSIVIESVGETSTDCRVETTIAPLGGLTRMTVRYGAACPLE